MANLFEVLSLHCSLLISNDEIDAAWRRLSQEFHPDVGNDQDMELSAQINSARSYLLTAAGRLDAWLEANDATSTSRNAAISSEMMDLFSAIGKILEKADQTIKSLKQSQTALAKSLLTGTALEVQLKLQTSLAKIANVTSTITDRFPEFEKFGLEGDFKEATTALGDLKFLQKWEKECQQRLLELISIE